jgi:hypothetical protein
MGGCVGCGGGSVGNGGSAGAGITIAVGMGETSIVMTIGVIVAVGCCGASGVGSSSAQPAHTNMGTSPRMISFVMSVVVWRWLVGDTVLFESLLSKEAKSVG